MANSNSSRLLQALRDEMGEEPEILLLENPPAVFAPGSVVISPGDPFIEPATQGLLMERWEILVVVAMKDRSIGIGQMRDHSLRVFRAVTQAGGRWLGASGPRSVQADEGRSLILSENTIEFKFDPSNLE